MNYVDLNELNNVKSKISYLLKMKYVENNNNQINNVEDLNIDAQFSEVLKLLNNSYQNLTQINSLFTMVNSGYFRNISSYTNFLKLFLNFADSLEQINILLNQIINQIGYVKPQNMESFLNLYQRYTTAYTNFTTRVFHSADGVDSKGVEFKKDEIKINKYASSGHSLAKVEENEINTVYKSIKSKQDEFINIVDFIKNNYNYKGTRTNNRISNIGDNQTVNLNYDED